MVYKLSLTTLREMFTCLLASVLLWNLKQLDKMTMQLAKKIQTQTRMRRNRSSVNVLSTSDKVLEDILKTRAKSETDRTHDESSN